MNTPEPKSRRDALRSSPPVRARAGQLRRRLSPPEVVLWSRVRRKQVLGLKFRRQHPLGPYIADFYCHEALLVVEIDGKTHGANRQSDAARDRWMNDRGLVVLRFAAGLIVTDIDAVLRTIAARGDERRRSLAAGRTRSESPGAPPPPADAGTSPAGAGEEAKTPPPSATGEDLKTRSE